MRTIRYYLKIYGMLASQYLKERMQFRLDFLCEVIGMFFCNVFELLTCWVVFQNITALGGWNFDEMVFLYGFALLARFPQQLLLDNAWTLSNKVVNGTFLKYCFRPVNILFYFMSETVDVKGFTQLLLGAIFMVYSWRKLKIPVTPANLLLLLFFLVGAALICMAMIILSSSFGFLGGGTNSVMFLASTLKDYSKYPLTIFQKGLRLAFTFVIPVGFIAYYPASFFLTDKGIHPMFVYLSPLIGLLFFLISSRVWICLANRYAGTGS